MFLITLIAGLVLRLIHPELFAHARRAAHHRAGGEREMSGEMTDETAALLAAALRLRDEAAKHLVVITSNERIGLAQVYCNQQRIIDQIVQDSQV